MGMARNIASCVKKPFHDIISTVKSNPLARKGKEEGKNRERKKLRD